MSKLDQIKHEIESLSSNDKWSLISHLIHERVGDHPDKEVAVCGPGDVAQVVIVPIQKWLDHNIHSSKDDKDGQSEKKFIPLKRAIEIVSKAGSSSRILKALEQEPPRSR